ncbi:MAG: hypothetical protein OEM67_04070 [Thermoleophilia bacterium]|nr:hypothetical protein [Thermoleophilia bacterium]
MQTMNVSRLLAFGSALVVAMVLAWGATDQARDLSANLRFIQNGSAPHGAPTEIRRSPNPPSSRPNRWSTGLYEMRTRHEAIESRSERFTSRTFIDWAGGLTVVGPDRVEPIGTTVKVKATHDD